MKAIKETLKIMDEKNYLFDIFWKTYPKKIKKKESKIRYCQYPQDIQERINKACNNYSLLIKIRKTERKFILHPTTFINGRWLDYENLNDHIDEKEMFKIEYLKTLERRVQDEKA